MQFSVIPRKLVGEEPAEMHLAYSAVLADSANKQIAPITAISVRAYHWIGGLISLRILVLGLFDVSFVPFNFWDREDRKKWTTEITCILLRCRRKTSHESLIPCFPFKTNFCLLAHQPPKEKKRDLITKSVIYILGLEKIMETPENSKQIYFNMVFLLSQMLSLLSRRYCLLYQIIQRFLLH